MATLLTLSGLLEWDETTLDGIEHVIDHACLLTYPEDVYKIYSGMEYIRVKNKIMYECGFLECIHQDPEIMKNAVIQWVDSNKLRWTKLYQTELYKYNPISNYDRKEEWFERDNESESQNGEGNNSGSGTNTRNVGAYNNDMQKAGEDVSNGSSSYSATGSKTAKKTRKHFSHIYGNVGVTTTQEMIEAERRVASFDIADIITREFKQQFCIIVY